MKNKIKLLGIIAVIAMIGLSFFSCGDVEEVEVENTVGQLTINGLSDYEGKNIRAAAYIDENSYLYACGNIIAKGAKFDYVIVNDGKVVLKVWKFLKDADKYANYAENSSKSINFTVYQYEDGTAGGVEIGTASVIFSNGTGSATFKAKE